MALAIRQIREESVERLQEILAETQNKAFQHRMRIATGEGVNPHEVRGMRLDIARIRTVLRSIELVAGRGGLDQAAARAALESNGWDIKRALAAASGAAAAPQKGLE
jgi:ribosomal protein L29